MGDQGSAWEPHQWMGDTMTVVVTGRRSDGTPLPRGTTLDEIRQANHLDENGDSTRPDFRGTTGINGVGSADALALPKFVVSSANSNNLAAVLRVLGSNPIGDSFWRAMQDHDRTQAVRNAPRDPDRGADGVRYSGPMLNEHDLVSDALKLAGYAAGGAGIGAARGDLLHNKSFWRQLDGTWRVRNAASESNYLLNRSYNLAGARLSGLKAAGRWIGGAGVVISFADIAYNGPNSRNVLDFGFGVAGFFPPVGTALSAVYTLGTISCDVYRTANPPPPPPPAQTDNPPGGW